MTDVHHHAIPAHLQETNQFSQWSISADFEAMERMGGYRAGMKTPDVRDPPVFGCELDMMFVALRIDRKHPAAAFHNERIMLTGKPYLQKMNCLRLIERRVTLP